MKQALNKFVTTEGVLGAYILNPEHGISESAMPAQFSEEALRQVGRNLAWLLAMARSDFSASEDISLFFENAAFRIFDIDKGYHLIIGFSSNANQTLLRKAVDRFVHEFKEAIMPAPTLSVVKPLDDSRRRKTGAQPAEALSSESLLKSGELAKPLGIMQTTLVKLIGPIAKTIFFDSLGQWMIIDKPCMDSLSLLTDIIVQKIGDTELSRSFVEQLPASCCSSAPRPSDKNLSKNKRQMKIVQNF